MFAILSIALLVITLVFEFLLEAQSDDVKESMNGFRGFLLFLLATFIFLWIILGGGF